LLKSGKLRRRFVTRALLALFVSVAAGLAVLLGGAALLPHSRVPSDDVFNALANGSVHPSEAAYWNRAVRLPGRLLFWGVFPVAALAVGVVACMIDRRLGVYLAPLAFGLIWTFVVWGSGIHRDSLLFGSFYMGLAVLSARLTSALRLASNSATG
jgi:hypothetical protein